MSFQKRPNSSQVLGGDFSGVVAQAGPGTTTAVGTAVFGLSCSYWPQPAYQGTYSEYACVREEWTAPLPPGLDAQDAAAVPLVALTALQALEKALPKPGQRILINGASGGVGMFAVQLSKCIFDLQVVALSSPANADFVKSLGADTVCDYADVESLVQQFSGSKFDIVFDVIGGALLDTCASQLLAPGGVLTHVRNRGGSQEQVGRYETAAAEGGPAFKVTLVQPSGKQMAQLGGLFQAGKLVVRVVAKMPLEEAGKAHEMVITGKAGGKVVLTM